MADIEEKKPGRIGKAILWYSNLSIKEHIKVAFLNTGFSMFFNLLPFWAGILIILSTGNWTSWSVFYGGGEFYLYSTSLISSSYLIYHNNKVRTADLSSFVSIGSLILIVIISILYASSLANSEPQLMTFIKWASIISISLAVPIFYYAQVVHNRKSPDIMEKRKNEQEVIINGLS
jgi:Kef-type K+ transport system membrane component KefB